MQYGCMSVTSAHNIGLCGDFLMLNIILGIPSPLQRVCYSNYYAISCTSCVKYRCTMILFYFYNCFLIFIIIWIPTVHDGWFVSSSWLSCCVCHNERARHRLYQARFHTEIEFLYTTTHWHTGINRNSHWISESKLNDITSMKIYVFIVSPGNIWTLCLN